MLFFFLACITYLDSCRSTSFLMAPSFLSIGTRSPLQCDAFMHTCGYKQTSSITFPPLHTVSSQCMIPGNIILFASECQSFFIGAFFLYVYCIKCLCGDDAGSYLACSPLPSLKRSQRRRTQLVTHLLHSRICTTCWSMLRTQSP